MIAMSIRPGVVAVVLAGCALVGGRGVVAAEPFAVGSETWQHTARTDGDLFTRADGTTVDFVKVPTGCAQQARTAEAARFDWVPKAYWPRLDTAGGKVVLCLELGSATVLATITLGQGKTASADLAPLLAEVVRSVRPAILVPTLGPIEPSLPPAMVSGDNLAFVIDGQPAGIGVDVRDHGTCAYEDALVITKLGEAADRAFADGYWPTVVEGKGPLYGCLDLREGYLSVIVNPATQAAALQDDLAEIRRAAYVRYGAPLATDVDPVVLPHTQQQLSARGAPGSWKVVDGEPFKRSGADVLVSTSAMGGDSTMYAVAVSEGPCAPGTVVAPPAVASALFPAELGTVWIDPDPYKLHWTGWACVDHGGVAATIAVLAPLAGDDPPEARDVRLLRPLIDALARSYGVALAQPVTPPPWHPNEHHGRLAGLAGGYFGVLSLAPGEGARRLGFLLGFDFRLQRPSGGFAYAFDVELGYGGGEWVGELRTGAGLALGRFDAVVGFGAGSTGPAAPADVYGQLSMTVPSGRSRLWLGAMHAIGWRGPNHEQLDVHLVVPGKDDSGLFFGARALWFGPDSETRKDNGTALLFTFGGGAASQD